MKVAIRKKPVAIKIIIKRDFLLTGDTQPGAKQLFLHDDICVDLRISKMKGWQGWWAICQS